MRNLMTHSAGFEETVRDLLVDRQDQVLPLDVYLKRRLPTRIFPPGKVIAYSNYGATLAGYIVQRISGEKFEDYIAQHIFAPLEMPHSSFVQPLPAVSMALMATGYLDAVRAKRSRSSSSIRRRRARRVRRASTWRTSCSPI